MPLKKAAGNMYDWISHTHSHLGGECPHKCKYCYVQKNRWGVNPRYQGEVRFIQKELVINYGSGKKIFIEHMNDMFADKIIDEWIKHILTHCRMFPDNDYIFQTKNPSFASFYVNEFPERSMIGTTIETNRKTKGIISEASDTEERKEGIKILSKKFPVFVTIEPILEFDVDILAEWMIDIKPKFINIGADSKGCGLEEPSADKINAFISRIKMSGLEIRKKTNLARLGVNLKT